MLQSRLLLAKPKKKAAAKKKGSNSLGVDLKTGLPVYVIVGPFGPYVQLGVLDLDGKQPKRVSVPKRIDPQQVTLEVALDLLNLPRTLGTHPETGKPVKVGIGRLGPYVAHGRVFRKLPNDHDVLKIDLATAVELLTRPAG
jgi:DNA topoisomerase-1